jgi:hypothetical protein
MIGYILDLKKSAWFFCVEVISPIGDVFSIVLNYCTNQEIKIYNFWKKQHFGKVFVGKNSFPIIPLLYSLLIR